MTDRLRLLNEQDDALKAALAKVDWPLEFGSVKIQIRNGKPGITTIERTLKND